MEVITYLIYCEFELFFAGKSSLKNENISLINYKNLNVLRCYFVRIIFQIIIIVDGIVKIHPAIQEKAIISVVSLS